MSSFWRPVLASRQVRFGVGIVSTYVCFQLFGPSLGAMFGSMIMSWLFVQDFYDGIDFFCKSLISSCADQIRSVMGWIRGDLRPVELFMDGCMNHKMGITLQLRAIYKSESKVELLERCSVLLSLFNLEQVAVSAILKSIAECTYNRLQADAVSPILLKRLSLLAVATDMAGITNFKSGNYLGGFAKSARDGETVAKELVSILQDLGLIEDPNAELFKNLTENLQTLNNELKWLRDVCNSNQASINKEDNKIRYFKIKDSIDDLLEKLTLQKTNQYSNRCFQMLFSQVTLIKSQTKTLFGEIDCMLANMSNRPTPVGVCFVGASRIGKSYLAEELRRVVAERLMHMAHQDESLKSAFGKAKDFLTWGANTRDDYDEGYYGQEFHYIDDAFQQKDHKDHLPLINFISNNPIGTVQAKIDAKGRPYRTYMVMCSTNSVPLKSSTIETIDALHQRFPVLVHCARTGRAPDINDRTFAHLRLSVTTMAQYAEMRMSNSNTEIAIGTPVTPDQIADDIARKIVAQYRIYVAASDVYATIAARMETEFQSDADTSKQMMLVRRVKSTVESQHHMLDEFFSSLYDADGQSPFRNRTFSSWFDVLKCSGMFFTSTEDVRLPGTCVLIDPVTTQKWLFGSLINQGKSLVLLPETDFLPEDYASIKFSEGCFDFTSTGFSHMNFVMPKYKESSFFEREVRNLSVYREPRLVHSTASFDLSVVQTAINKMNAMFSPLNTFYGKLVVLIGPILGLSVWDTVGLFLKEHKKLISGVVVSTVLVAFGTFIYKMCTVKDGESQSSAPSVVPARKRARKVASVQHTVQTSAPAVTPAKRRVNRTGGQTSAPKQVRPVRKAVRAESSPSDLKGRKRIRPLPQDCELLDVPYDVLEYDIEKLSIEAQNMDKEMWYSYDEEYMDFSQDDIVSQNIFISLKAISSILANSTKKAYRIMGGCGTASPSQRRDLFVAEGLEVVNFAPSKTPELMVVDAAFDYYPHQFSRRPTLCFSMIVRGSVEDEDAIMDLIELVVPNHSSIGVSGFITGEGEILMNFIVLSRESQDTIEDMEDRCDVDLSQSDAPSKETLAKFKALARHDIDVSVFNHVQSSDDQSLQLCKTFFDKYSVIVWATPERHANNALRKGDFTGLGRVYHGIGCENYVLTLNHGSAGVGTYQIFTRQKGVKSDGLRFSEQKEILFGICTGTDEHRDTSVYRLLTRDEIRCQSQNFAKLLPLLDTNINFGSALLKHMMTEERLSHVFKNPQDVCFTCPTVGVTVMGRCERSTYVVHVGQKQKHMTGLETSIQGSVNMVGAETWTNVIQAPTQNGDCGGAYFLMNSTITTKFVGLHHAGNYSRNVAFSTVVSSDLFNSLKKPVMFNANRLQSLDLFGFEFDGRGALHVPPITMAPSGDDLFSVFVDKSSQGSNVPAGEHVRSYGKYLLPHRPEGRGSTQYKHRSPFYGCFDIVRFPPPFYATDNRIKETLPRNSKGQPSLTLRANNAMGMKAPPLNQEILNECVEKMSSWFALQMATRSIGIYPGEDVIHLGMNGRSTNKFVRHMRVGKSAGAPHTALGCPRKSDYVELNSRGNYTFKNTPNGMKLRDLVYDKLEKSGKLIRTTSFIGCSLKDQPIADKHIKAGKVRVFYPVPIENFLIGRGLFGPFWEAMSSEPILFRNSIGINELSMDWKNLYDQLAAKGNVIDLDFKEWDKHLPAELLIGAYMIAISAIEKATDDGFKNHRIVHMWEMVRSIVIDGDTAFVTDHGNKSGSPDTTHINSLAGLLSLFYIYSKIVGYVDLDEFMEMVYSSHNGDDIAIAVHDNVKHLFNYETLTKSYAEMGMIATPGMKGDFVEGQLFTTLQDMTFLKRQFVPFEDMVFCPIDEASVYSRFGWTRNTLADLEEIKGTINAAMDEWVMMGQAVYDRNMQILRSRVMERGFDSSVRNAVASLLSQDYQGHLGYVRFLFHANVPRFDLDLQKDRYVYRSSGNQVQEGIAGEISKSGNTLYKVLDTEGVPSLRSDLERVQSDVAFLAQRTEALEGRVNVLNSRVLDLDDKIGVSTQQVEKLTTEVESLSTNVSKYDTRITSLETKANTTDIRVGNLSQDVRSLTTKVNSMDSRVYNNETQIRNRVRFDTYYQFRTYNTGVETRTEIKGPSRASNFSTDQESVFISKK